MKELKYSVLMSVYYKENPSYFRDSIKSMLEQSVKPDEIIIVADGKLTPELDAVFEEFKDNSVIKVIRLKVNSGLGEALSIGIKECRNELIARMDTDDLSDAYRCEKQLQCFYKNKRLSVVGTAVSEFIDDPDIRVAYKGVKTGDKDIKNQMKYRNAFNHPSVMFKKSEVLQAGSYEQWFLNEDYYLWIRMMEQSAIFENIDEPLLKMRITNDTYLRRGGWKYFVTQKKLYDYMLSNHLINVFEYSFNNSIRFVTRLLIPNKLRKILYLNILRKKA
ncbi:glycosyltransferase [Clostridium sp.]|jgi:glycosyltransferase involved in cell wall biosynthesis|uniref:glycosyltransferase n=1 Tax=Clostridium sp. TaxID=1506 RepID=UPI003EE8EDE6